MAEHEVKIYPEYYNPVKEGRKTFEIRLNDRNYKEGDLVTLREFSGTGEYTGRELFATVGYVSSYHQREDMVVFSLLNVGVK